MVHTVYEQIFFQNCVQSSNFQMSGFQFLSKILCNLGKVPKTSQGVFAKNGGGSTTFMKNGGSVDGVGTFFGRGSVYKL